RKVLTVLGFNPTNEFSTEIDPELLYETISEDILAIARKLNVRAVFMPTNPLIHSNRREIIHAIQNKKYPTRPIPEVRWTDVGGDVGSPTFSEVFVLQDFDVNPVPPLAV